MAIYLFTALRYLLLALLMCGTLLCGQAYACGSAPPPTASQDPVELFHNEQISVDFQPNGETEEEGKKVCVKDFYFPILVSTNKFFVALTGVNRTDVSKKNITVLTKYINNEDLLLKDVENIKTNLKTQFAVQHVATKDFNKIFKSILAVANQNNVYILLANQTKNDPDAPNNINWEFKLAVGTVSNIEASAGKGLAWVKHDLTAGVVTNKLNEEFKKGQLIQYPHSGSAFLSNDNKTVFVLVVEDKSKKKICVNAIERQEHREAICI